jgi:hypothetical protein
VQRPRRDHPLDLVDDDVRLRSTIGDRLCADAIVCVIIHQTILSAATQEEA